MKGGTILTTQPVYSVAQSCLTLCNPEDSSPLGSSVPGVLQARPLEQVRNAGLLSRRLGGRPTCETALPTPAPQPAACGTPRFPVLTCQPCGEGDRVWLGMFMLTESFLFAAV